jgi:putative membrane protein
MVAAVTTWLGSSRPRRLALAFGLLTLAAAWLGPLPQLAQRSFAAHMAMHVAVVAIAAPLLAIGLAGGRGDPVAKAPALFAPVPASVIELVVVWAWHAPTLHHAARHHAALFVAEQASFLAAGLLVWLAAFGGDGLRRTRAAAGIGALLLTSMHMTLLGVLLAGAARPLYAHDALAGSAPFGLTPLQDQHLGGVLMLAVGGTAYLAGALMLLAGLLRERRGSAA